MRILELHLKAFGPFTDRVLDFSATDGPGLHVVYGPNEAGKSSAMRGLVAFLYGFPEWTSDDFLHSHDQLCVAARVLTPGGDTLRLSRLKRHKASLRDEAGEPVDEAVIERLLGGVSRQLFTSLFRIDRQGLARAGRALLENRGELGESLFQAATGLTRLRRVQEQLEAEADELFRRAAVEPRINQLLAEYEGASKAVQRAALPPTRWLDVEARWLAALRQQAELAARVKALAARQLRTRRQLDTQPLLRRRDALEHELAALGLQPDLTHLDLDALKGSVDRLEQAQAEAHQLARDIDQLSRDISAVAVSRQILHERERIEQLHRRLDSYQRSVEALDRLDPTLEPDQARTARIERRRALVRSVQQDTAELAQRLGLEPADQPVEALVQDLHDSLLAQVGAAATRRERERALDRLERRHARQSEEIARAHSELAPLKRAVGSLDVARLREALDLGLRGRALRRQLAEVVAQLTAIGSAHARVQTRTRQPEQLGAQEDAIESELDALARQWQATSETVGAARREFDQLSGQADALEAAEGAQSVLTRLRHASRRFLLLRTASLVLGRAVEAYRDHKGPMVLRAGDLFARLTAESFDGLVTRRDDRGLLTLEGRRPSREPVSLDAMSDGTRDQLSLALRLAGLEHHVIQHGPLPFFVDDVLVNFDDARARAALSVLSDLSERVQMLFFTHRTHAVELARQVVPAGRLAIHPLDVADRAAGAGPS